MSDQSNVVTIIEGLLRISKTSRGSSATARGIARARAYSRSGCFRSRCRIASLRCSRNSRRAIHADTAAAVKGGSHSYTENPDQTRGFPNAPGIRKRSELTTAHKVVPINSVNTSRPSRDISPVDSLALASRKRNGSDTFFWCTSKSAAPKTAIPVSVRQSPSPRSRNQECVTDIGRWAEPTKAPSEAFRWPAVAARNAG